MAARGLDIPQVEVRTWQHSIDSCRRIAPNTPVIYKSFPTSHPFFSFHWFSISIVLSVSLSLYLYFSLSISISLFLSLFLSFSLSIYLSLSLYLSLYISIYIYIFLSLSFVLFSISILTFIFLFSYPQHFSFVFSIFVKRTVCYQLLFSSHCGGLRT